MATLRPDHDTNGFYLDTEQMLSVRTSPIALGIAMSLISEIWWPTQQPFTWDSSALAERITAPDVSPDLLEKHREDVATYFTVLDDGRWVPSPQFFSVTNGNPGHAS